MLTSDIDNAKSPAAMLQEDSPDAINIYMGAEYILCAWYPTRDEHVCLGGCDCCRVFASLG